MRMRTVAPAGTLKLVCAALPCLAALALILTACRTTPAKERRVLVYTKNQVGKGFYVHDNIPASVAAIKKLGAENNFAVDVSDDPARSPTPTSSATRPSSSTTRTTRSSTTRTRKPPSSVISVRAAGSSASIPPRAQCGNGPGSGPSWVANSAATPRCSPSP